MRIPKSWAFLALILLIALGSHRAPYAQPLPGSGFICGMTAHSHFTTAADTVIVNLTSKQNIVVCDYEVSTAGTTDIYLESSAANTCTSPTAITQIWHGTATSNKTAPNAFYRGINAGTSNALCVNSSGSSVAGDVTVYYDQR